MQITPIKQNMFVADLGESRYYHTKVLHNYSTPVAYSILGPEGMTYFKTEQKHSVTTSKHLNEWCHNYDEVVGQDVLDELVK